MDIHIRLAVLEDYENLCEIYEELDEFHRDNHPELFIKPEHYTRAREYIGEIIKDENKALFVAEVESKLLGFAECFIMKSSSFPVIRKREWVQLDGIAVRRDFQNSHVGTLLLNQVKEWTQKKAINRIELKVYHFNTNAIRFYTDRGFKDLNKTMYLNL